jgi:hypothetical protein
MDRELKKLEEIDKGSTMQLNFNSLLVNMSRYLFEPPHSEETNYFSTTYRMDEKSFLLFLSMFIANVDLSTDPEQPKEEQKSKPIELPSTDYMVSEPEVKETLSLLFEGQTRKFTSLNFLYTLCSSGAEAPNSDMLRRPPISDTLEKLMCNDANLQKTLDILMPLSNELQSDEKNSANLEIQR